MVIKITKTRIISLYLNDYSRKLYLRELAFLLKKPHQSIKPYVGKLVKDRILIKTKRKNLVEYSLNFKNKQIYEYLVIAEKERLIEGLKKDYVLNILYEKLSPYFGNSVFVVFGSASEKLEKDSDIDLLIVGKRDVSREIKAFEKIYNKKIHKIQVSRFNKINMPLIREIYKKHLILNDAEQVIRFFGSLHEKNQLV